MQGLQGGPRKSEKNTKMIRILQTNMNRSRLANDLLLRTIGEMGVDMLLISEQYRDKEEPAWFPDTLGTAAIWIPSKSIAGKVAGHGRGNGFVWVSIGGITFVSCYFTPNETIQEFIQKLDELEDKVRDIGGEMVVAGDFNAKAIEWGMTDPDTRGRLVMEMVARLNLIVMNTGNTPTFRRPGYRQTIPDVTFASGGTASRLHGWTVSERYSASDHQYISFRIQDNTGIRRTVPQCRRWNAKKLNEETFAMAIHDSPVDDNASTGNVGRQEAELLVDSTMKILHRACERAMPRQKPRHDKPGTYWWTEEISELRKACHRMRRRAQRARNGDDGTLLHEEYRNLRRTL